MNLMAMVTLRRRKSLTTMVVVEIVVTVIAVLVGAIPLAKVVMGRNDDGVMILNSMTTSRFALVMWMLLHITKPDRGHIIPHSCAETSYTERQQFSWLALILDLTS